MPKTATHAVRQALAPYLAADDWQQQDLFEERRLPIPDLAKLKHGHISVRQIRPHIADELWNSYYKFGFVRNPFDRFVSTCFFLNRKDHAFEKSALSFMKRALTIERFRKRVLVVPQSLLLTDSQGNIGLDSVGRYECVQESFDQICERIGIPTTNLATRNPSNHLPYTEYYDEELREMVAQFYDQDLSLFSYRFEPSVPMN